VLVTAVDRSGTSIAYGEMCVECADALGGKKVISDNLRKHRRVVNHPVKFIFSDRETDRRRCGRAGED